MSSPPDPPPRVRVTSPRARARAGARRTAAAEIDAQSPLGELYLRSLLRTQLRLALGVLGGLLLTVGGLPVLFIVAPDLARRPVLGMPLSWVLIGFAVYPVLVGLGWWFVRASERNERAFTEVVERPGRR